MHSAPSVTYPVGRSRFLGAALLLVWLLGVAAVGLWWAQVQPLPWRALFAPALVIAVGMHAARRWLRTATGTLGWDGEHWAWSGTSHTGGALQVSVDLQHGLLLRWTSGNASRWLWLERAGRPERWDDLRRAVYSRARPEALAGAHQPPAKP